MTRTMTITEVKAKLLSLVDEIEGGDDILITRHGVTIARLSPARGAHALKDRYAGIATDDASDEDLFSTGVRWNLQ